MSPKSAGIPCNINTLLFSLSLALLLGFSQSAVSAVFDLFTEIQVAVDVTDGGAGDSQSTATGIASIVGGQRDINTNAVSGAGDINSNGACDAGDRCSVLAISGGTLRFNNDTGVLGTGIVQWDGPDQDIALVENGIGANLAASQTGFVLKVLESDQPVQITLEAYSNSAAYTKVEILIPQVIFGAPLTQTIAFADLETCVNTAGFASLECAPGDVPVDFADFGALQLLLNSGSPATVAIDLQIADLGTTDGEAALGDRVWEDLDADGIQDCVDGGANDPNFPADGIIGNDGDAGAECDTGVPGVTVNLLDPGTDGVCGTGDEQFIEATATDANGFYLFSPLDPGQYCVEIVKPLGLECTLNNQGADDAADSDVIDQGDGTCQTVDPGQNPIDLTTGETDLSWDAGLVRPEAALGDRIWEDRNANGIQDCIDGGANDPNFPADGVIGNEGDAGPECDAGIPNLRVELLMGDCSIPTGMETFTNANGFYLFDGLQPGDYCVRFSKPAVDFCATEAFDLGAPQFTQQNVDGDDTVDSDAHTGTGKSDVVNLSAGETDLTVDAGIVCPAKLGDRVWEDTNEDGLQDCQDDNGNGILGDAGDSGSECGAGVPGVTVELFGCGPDGIPGTNDDVITNETRMTDANGFYMFGGEPGVFDLAPGDYYVQFMKPGDRNFTTPNVGTDDSIDSNCNLVDGKTACTSLGSGGIDLGKDCGLIPPPPPSCDLTLDKKCRVETPPVVSGDEKCDGKLKEFTVIWTGGNINISGLPNNAPGGAVSNGQEVTFTGPFDSNDVFVNITGAVTGQSKFHMSCSDPDMDGSSDTNDAQQQVSVAGRDCGKDQGDAKSNGDPDFINDWQLEGFVDNSDQVLDCTTGPVDGGGFTDNCTILNPVFPSCDTLGKPASLVFQYTGGGCSESDNSQGADKAKCTPTGNTVAGAVTIEAAGNANFDKDIYTVVPTMVDPDGTFEIKNNGSDLKSNSYIVITDANGNVELNQIHTSCSVTLEVGDVFGSLTLVSFDGQTGGANVTYSYTVTNNGDALTGIMVTDDKLGDIAGPFDLGAGEVSDIFEVTASITGTTINTATATGLLPGGVTECPASDMVTVEVLQPVTPVSCSDIKDITAVSVIWNGPDGVDVVTESGEVFLNIQSGNRITFQEAGTGNDVELNLGGAVTGLSKFHVSCSDEAMNGTEDCGNNAGDGKGSDSSLNNDWLFDGMTGQGGSFDCMLPNTGVVAPEAGGGGPAGGNVTAAATLDLGDDGKAKWELTNNGTVDVFITGVTVTWPAAHGMLKKFKLEGDFAKDVDDATSPTSVPADKAFESDANKRKLKKGDSKKLEIEFYDKYKGHTQGDFTITVDFDNGQTLFFP